MNVALLTIALAVVAGALIAIQAPTNALLSRPLDSPVTAAFISFVVGTLALGLLAWLLPSRPDAAGVRALPWYVWLGGLYGAFFVAVAAFGAPRVGWRRRWCSIIMDCSACRASRSGSNGCWGWRW